MQERIKNIVEQAIRTAFDGIEMPDVVVMPPEREEFGDYTSNVALMLAKSLKKNPMEVAQLIAEDMQEAAPELIKKINVVAPGFMNISLENNVILKAANNIIENAGLWEKGVEGKNKTVIVDYFQLNIAKQPHIGHLRSAVIGDALKRVLHARGYVTISDTHVGDWGTQFGILLYAYKKAVGDDATLRESIKNNPFMGLQELYAAANKEEDAPELGKAEFAKLEQGDKENREIWQWMVDISMKKLEQSATRLKLLAFEEHKGESAYEDAMPPIVEDALAKQVAKKTDNGAVIVDLTGEGLDEAVLIKSDGASTYLLRDLATIKYRKEKYNFWKNLYVVDNRQSHHFRQLFRVAELLGFEGVGASEHVEFGFMKLPEGAMSTRAGNTISLDAVLDEAETRARNVIQEKNPDLADADEVAKKVGLGAIKFFDLSHNRTSDVVFRWEDVLSFEGNTGPYIQYTHARLKSILRKSPDAIGEQFPGNAVLDDKERSLLFHCTRLPEAMGRVIELWSPHVIAHYLFELSQKANEFYHSHPVLSEENKSKKELRLMIIQVVATTLAAGMQLLGIDAPGEM